MQLDIDGSSVVRRSMVRRHIEREIARRLGPFAHRIGTVRIRLRERALSEPTRTFCGIGVTLEPRDEFDPWVLARAEDDDACLAVDRAVERVAKTLSEKIARRDQEAALRSRALVAYSRSGIVEGV